MSSMLKGIAGYQQGRAAHAEERLNRQMMAQEKIDRELQRARELKRVLAANRASAGARGIVVGLGSEKAISDFNFQRYDEDTAADTRNTQFRIATSRYRGKVAKRGATLSLAAGVVGTGEDIYRMKQ